MGHLFERLGDLVDFVEKQPTKRIIAAVVRILEIGEIPIQPFQNRRLAWANASARSNRRAASSRRS